MTAAPFALASALTARALGGLACEWNNGESYSEKRGLNPAYVGFRIVILPDAASQWARYIDYYGADGAGLYCFTAPSGVIGCNANDLVTDRWVEITSYGTISEDAAAALHTIVLGAVAAAGPGAPPWTPPAGTLPLPTECAGLVPFGIVASAVGSTLPIESSVGGGGWSLRAGANVNAGVVSCSWTYGASDLSPGGIQSLGAGAWAWNEARPALTTPSTPEALPIGGLEDSDQAWIRCAPANTECVVDLVIGGNWIEFVLYQDDGFGSGVSDPRAAATTIAEGVVATLRP